ncbi:hypothetical protein Hte_008730 [Hypoxylon texense]
MYDSMVLMEECLKAYKGWGSEDQFPFEYSKYYNNTAATFMQLGRFEEALTPSKREVNMETLVSYSMTGVWYFYAKQYEKAKEHLLKCLERQNRLSWSEEGIAAARNRLAQVLRALGEVEEGDKQEKEAATVADKYLKECGEFLQPKDENDPIVYDQMTSFCAGGLTGRRGSEVPMASS